MERFPNKYQSNPLLLQADFHPVAELQLRLELVTIVLLINLV